MSSNNAEERKDPSINLEKANLINLKSKTTSNDSALYNILVSRVLSKEGIGISKYILSFILLIYIFIKFNIDDILPYAIKKDLYYEKILNETSKNNSETFMLNVFGVNKTYLTKEIISKFNSFIKICLSDQLIDNNTYPLLPNPKISVIMPLYNGGKYLYYSLRSIQNQKMKEIEIIFIDDNSPDDTIAIVAKYMKKDPRIRLIRNEFNRKILYSKSMAALNSRGKYIIQLDQDDLFIRDDVFDLLYSEAENNDFDLVQIRDVTKNNFHFNRRTIVNNQGRHFIYPKNTEYKTQPELKDTLFINNNVFLLWGLLIKADIYKKAVYHLWKIIINYQIIFHEDYTISFMIVILARNYKYLNNFAIIHLNHIKSASSNHWFNSQYYLGILFFGNNLFDFHIKNNPKDIKLAINYIHLFYQEFEKEREIFPNILKIFINKILSNHYLSLSDRNFIENKILQIKKNKKSKNNSLLDIEEYNTIYDFQNSKLNMNFTTEYKSNPKISVLIVFNEAKYLQNTIKSVQNQKFNNFEIILIYDNSIEINLNSIQKYIQNFPNIKFINNKEHKGFLYSISLGVLLSNGEYILTLESGYTLAKSYTLNDIYNEAINNNIDILEFNILVNNNDNMTYDDLSLYKCEHIKTSVEKELYDIKFIIDVRDIDQEKELLVNKLVKADLYKNVTKKYKLVEYKNKVNNYYDEILLFILKQKKTKFKHIDNFGVIQYFSYIEDLNKNKNNNKTQLYDDSIFYINFLYQKSNNTFEDKEKVFNEFNNVLSIIFNKFRGSSKESNLLYEKFMDCEYISNIKKRMLMFYHDSLLN